MQDPMIGASGPWEYNLSTRVRRSHADRDVPLNEEIDVQSRRLPLALNMVDSTSASLQKNGRT